MWKPSNKISVNASSILDLKSELIRTKEEVKRAREDDDFTSTHRNKTRTGSKDKTKNTLAFKGADNTEEVIAEAKRMAIMEQKSRMYDKLSNGEYLQDVDDENVMVDFDRKYLEADHEEDHEEEEYVEITDEYGRTRRVPRSEAVQQLGITVNLESDYKEYDESDTRGYHMFPPIAMNYAQKHIDTREADKEKVVRDEEAEDEFQTLLMKASKVDRFNHQKELTRQMGVGFYQFADDDKERKKQMEELKELRTDTETSRSKLDDLKAERRRKMQERMGKIQKKKEEVTVDNIKKEDVTIDSIKKEEVPTKVDLKEPPITTPEASGATQPQTSGANDADSFLRELFQYTNRND